MGQANSTSVTEVLNTSNFTIDQSVENNIQSDCYATSDGTNIVSIVGSTVTNLSTNQSNIVKNLCTLKTMINGTQEGAATTKLMNEIAKELESKAQALGGSSNSQSYSNVVNQMSAHIDQSTRNNILKNCILAQDQDNVIQIFGSDVSDTNLSQVNDAMVECLQTYEDVRKATASASGEAATKEDVTAKSTSEGLFSSSGSLVWVSIAALVLAAIVAIVFLQM